MVAFWKICSLFQAQIEWQELQINGPLSEGLMEDQL